MLYCVFLKSKAWGLPKKVCFLRLNQNCWSILVATDSILRLTRVPATGYVLQLIPPFSWLWFRWLDTSCDWFYPAADSRCGDWIRVTADSTLLLNRVPAAGYDLRLIPSCDWLWFAVDSISSGSIRGTSYSWFHLATNCELQLILSCGWLEFCRLDSTCSWLIL